MELFLKIILSLFTSLCFIYNFIVVITTLSPTLTGILRTWEFRLPKGYNLLRFIFSIGLASFTGFLCIKLIRIIVDRNYIENTFFDVLYPVTWLFGISIATIFVRISQVRSLCEQLKIFKHTKDENLLEPRKMENSNNPQNIILHNYLNNINTFNTEVNIDNSSSETLVDNSSIVYNIESNKVRHPVLKNLSSTQLKNVVINFKDIIKIEEKYFNNLIDLFDGNEIIEKIKIEVILESDERNFINGITFIKSIVNLKNVLNPYTNKNIKDTDIANYIDKNFTIVTNYGKPKKSITAQDLFHN